MGQLHRVAIPKLTCWTSSLSETCSSWSLPTWLNHKLRSFRALALENPVSLTISLSSVPYVIQIASQSTLTQISSSTSSSVCLTVCLWGCRPLLSTFTTALAPATNMNHSTGSSHTYFYLYFPIVSFVGSRCRDDLKWEMDAVITFLPSFPCCWLTLKGS